MHCTAMVIKDRKKPGNKLFKCINGLIVFPPKGFVFEENDYHGFYTVEYIDKGKYGIGISASPEHEMIGQSDTYKEDVKRKIKDMGNYYILEEEIIETLTEKCTYCNKTDTKTRIKKKITAEGILVKADKTYFVSLNELMPYVEIEGKPNIVYEKVGDENRKITIENRDISLVYYLPPNDHLEEAKQIILQYENDLYNIIEEFVKRKDEFYDKVSGKFVKYREETTKEYTESGNIINTYKYYINDKLAKFDQYLDILHEDPLEPASHETLKEETYIPFEVIYSGVYYTDKFKEKAREMWQKVLETMGLNYEIEGDKYVSSVKIEDSLCKSVNYTKGKYGLFACEIYNSLTTAIDYLKTF